MIHYLGPVHENAIFLYSILYCNLVIFLSETILILLLLLLLLVSFSKNLPVLPQKYYTLTLNACVLLQNGLVLTFELSRKFQFSIFSPKKIYNIHHSLAQPLKSFCSQMHQNYYHLSTRFIR